MGTVKVKKDMYNEDSNLPEFNQPSDGQYSLPDSNPNNIGNRLLHSKISRKKIELDAMALKNRIMLLENEESKVMQKIEETKRKALHIIQIKQRNREHDEEQIEYKKYTKIR